MSHKTFRASLVVTLLAVVAALPAFAQTPPFTRTVIVPGNASPTANGTALLTALAGITTASAADPWKILVEPGIFDLQTSTLQLKDFIDIQGSGRDVTYIRSAGARTAFVPAGVNAELRDLTVQSFTDASGTAVRNESDRFLLTQVNLEAVSVGNAIGFSTKKSNPRVSEVFARIASESGSAVGAQVIGGGPVISEYFSLIEVADGNGVGYEIVEGAFATLLEVRAQVQQSFNNGFGISIAGSTVAIQNCNVSVKGPTGSVENRGIFAQAGSRVTIKDCVSTASGGNRPAGLWVSDSTAQANESSFTATVGSFSLASFGLFNANGANTQLDRCTVDGTIAVRNFSSTDVSTLGASRLVGSLAIAGGSVISCAQSYNGANVDVGPGCV